MYVVRAVGGLRHNACDCKVAGSNLMVGRVIHCWVTLLQGLADILQKCMPFWIRLINNLSVT